MNKKQFLKKDIEEMIEVLKKNPRKKPAKIIYLDHNTPSFLDTVLESLEKKEL